MPGTLIDLRNRIQEQEGLDGLRAAIVQQLVGEPFLFGRMAYADELILHYGGLREYTVPRFGKRTEGTHALSVRGSAWLIKSGSEPLAAEGGLLPAESPSPFGKPITKEVLEAGLLVGAGARVVVATPFLFEPAHGYGLELLHSDGSRITILPSPGEAAALGDEQLPEVADWELLSPFGILTVGPGAGWTYTPSRDDTSNPAGDRGQHAPRVRQIAPSAPNPPDMAVLEAIQIPQYVWGDRPGGFGFPEIRVFEVFANPSRTEIVRWQDLQATIYARSLPGHTDLVCVEDNKPKKGVYFAFRVFPDLCRKPLAEATPLEIVESFVEKFGVPISVGARTAKLLLKEELRIPTILIPGVPEGQFYHVEAPANSVLVNCFFFKLVSPIVHIALAFCIDGIKYDEWAKAHEGS